MVKRPTPDFWDASHDTDKAKSKLKDPLELNPERDKDNASKVPKPPTHVLGGGATNLAPRGFIGTKRDLPTPAHQKTPDKPTFKKSGDLKREFQPIVRNNSKDRGHER